MIAAIGSIGIVGVSHHRLASREEGPMCMSCGCGEPHEDHGDARNITYAHLKKAADASKIPVKKAVKNIETTLRTKKPRSIVAQG